MRVCDSCRPVEGRARRTRRVEAGRDARRVVRRRRAAEADDGPFEVRSRTGFADQALSIATTRGPD